MMETRHLQHLLVGLVIVFGGVRGNGYVRSTTQVLAVNDTMLLICRTADHFTDSTGSRAKVKLVQNDNLVIYDMRTEEAGTDKYPNVELNHDVIVKFKALQLEFTKSAQLSDTGVYKCIIDGRLTSVTNVTVVGDEPTEIVSNLSTMCQQNLSAYVSAIFLSMVYTWF